MDLDHDACYRAICARDPRFDGRLFTGVKTTGIYCRPICPARTPHRDHVVFFPTAAAAQEAGFRPCLRCRPETAPDLGAWRGSSNTVSRALSLIELGALDEAAVDVLAERLGLGERQLRRLFHRHLGASPVAVAQTRRVLLAKQLIHETSLPMTEIALAAGFGSLRRFNETFQSLFQRPPSALRRVRTIAPAAAPGEIVLLLRYKPPYDWPTMLDYLRARAIKGVECVDDGVYRRTIAHQGEHGTLSVQPAETDALKVHVRFGRLTALPTIIARLRRVFDLAADPDAVALDLAKDPMLATLVAARPGLRLPGAWDGFELAVRAILGQQVSVAAATALVGRLTSKFGERLRCFDPVLTHVFPEAGRHGRSRSCERRHAAQSCENTVAARGGVCRRPAPVLGCALAGGRAGAASRASGNRRMDRALHCAAPAARAGRLPRGRYRIATRHVGWRGRASKPRRTAGPRRTLAPVARLCGAIFVDERRRQRATGGLNGQSPTKGLKPPKNMRLPSNAMVSGVIALMRGSCITRALTSSRWARDS